MNRLNSNNNNNNHSNDLPEYVSGPMLRSISDTDKRCPERVADVFNKSQQRCHRVC
jgi:hypothetical protein